MNNQEITDGIEFLERKIKDFDIVQKMFDISKNSKEKNILEEKLYDVMFEAKDYILADDCYEFVYADSNAGRKSAFISGLTKKTYFRKDLKYFIDNFKQKIQ